VDVVQRTCVPPHVLLWWQGPGGCDDARLAWQLPQLRPHLHVVRLSIVMWLRSMYAAPPPMPNPPASNRSKVQDF